jgi:hypothetical protein
MPLTGTWAGTITGDDNVPLRMTVAFEEGSGWGDWGQIVIRDEAGIGCTYVLTYVSPEWWDEWWVDFGLPEPEDGELVYSVEDACYDCYRHWIELSMVFVRPTDDGDIEVTPFWFERDPSVTLGPGDPPPAVPAGSLVVDSTTVERGQKLTVTVSSYFAWGISISWFVAGDDEWDGDWQELYLGDVDTDADGNGTFAVTVPLGVPDGPAVIAADGWTRYGYCEGLASAMITVAGGPTPAPAASALPTLPPTDAATRSAVLGSDQWRLVLVGLAALVVGVLIAGSPRTTPRRR